MSYSPLYTKHKFFTLQRNNLLYFLHSLIRHSSPSSLSFSVLAGQRDQQFRSVRQIVGTVGHERELHVVACSPRSAAAAVYASLSHAAGDSLPGQQDGFQTPLKALLSSC